ncbi:hypothetical protein SPBR_02101 [Sporothrix brasiliensis 5110]|uniref:Ubiquitin-like domain-containing protein n=1 Tax=Sporothrix brasiliensis 5110 TaxID=1398154 RepID=A0A0C2EXH1_9PEZI|nr:uncharacterized protein SPBR_02101 [Sporothrix brasiliensis 5110]KIH91309.1 hypothetical protein SPBR_02101 [Sporothrix brasiliensis 5110]
MSETNTPNPTDNKDGAAAGGNGEAAAPVEHLNIKVTDNNNEVFFKIKRTTKLEKLMTAFCDRQGKSLSSVRFLFDGQRVQPSDTPDTVASDSESEGEHPPTTYGSERKVGPPKTLANSSQLEMQDSDTLEVHQEQLGGGN